MKDKCIHCGKEGCLVFHCQICKANNIGKTIDAFNKLAQQAELLGRALLVLRVVASASYNLDYLNYCRDCNAEWGYKHKDECMVGKAQALIPDLEAPRIGNGKDAKPLHAIIKATMATEDN